MEVIRRLIKSVTSPDLDINVDTEKLRRAKRRQERQERRENAENGKAPNEKQAVDKTVEHILKNVEALKSMNPYSPEFLGKDIVYPAKDRRLFFRPSKALNLVDLRDEVNKASELNKVNTARKKINNLLKKNRYNPELRALSGIQLYNDTFQSGLDENKLHALRRSVVETASAIHNGGISIFNVNWFIRIYLKYLEILHRQIVNERSKISTNYHWLVRKAADELNIILMQVTSMQGIKKNMSGLTVLNTRLKDSAYTYNCITKAEITEAAHSMVKGENKTIGSGKTANYIIWVIITLSSLFARIPILEGLITDTMSAIPDISRELTLQKKMVGTASRITKYQLAVAEGDRTNIAAAAKNLYIRCLEIIKQYLTGATTLKKSYEVDPFLKIAWIVKESNGLFEAAVYKQMLEEALKQLNIVIKQSLDVKDSHELATKLQREITDIMTEYGWMK
ncbi:MAG: hypothetical protein HOE30_11070 [Deltaproteobacteria bacterium]|nr:hypothetical protein [Deltaproteobacteria bacterium]MBT4268452.1 hypothetical protein [Deltaproteobacteria bacterium]MBT4638569.1 hypothetical protein [Deltaproteobacteria bacterium]MBT6613192.1 hypothetical protein [Deltaproteobacteria bacterium]